MRKRPTAPRPRGFALVILLALVATLAYVLLGALNARSQNLQREKQTGEALARAKEGLLAYAAASAFTDTANALDGRFGYLPCPEDTGAVPEGSEQSSVTCGTTTISRGGRLPWRALGLPAPVDGASECLWYAVSGRYKRTHVQAGNPLMDADGYLADGQIEIFNPQGGRLAGIPGDRVVAVVFAPGPPQGNQTHVNSSGRTVCPGNFTAANYLDADTSGSPITDPDTGTALTIDNAVVSGTAGAVTHLLAGAAPERGINDRLIYITRDEVYAAMVPFLKDLTRRAASCIAYFAQRNNNYPTDKRIPWAARLGLDSSFFNPFANDCAYNDNAGTYAGRLANRVGDSASMIPNNWFVADFCGQARNQLLALDTPCTGWAPYIPLWQRWKSLFFYHVAPSYRPAAPTPSNCGTCLQVNGAGNYAAVVLFAGRVLTGQENRSSNRDDADEYLEGRNDNNIEDASGNNRNYETQPMSTSFNDILYCLAPDLSVARCP
jgi:hypothetical protein